MVFELKVTAYFFPIPRSFLCVRLMALLVLLFCYNFYPTTLYLGTEPTSYRRFADLHQTGTFEGRSTDWATAPRLRFPTYLPIHYFSDQKFITTLVLMSLNMEVEKLGSEFDR